MHTPGDTCPYGSGYPHDDNAPSNPASLVALDGYEHAAGAIVWWDLSGEVDIMDLDDAWSEIEGAPELLPAVPSTMACAKRAADKAVRSRRELVRPLTRGAWDFQIESVVISQPGEAQEAEILQYETAVKIRVDDKTASFVAVGDQDRFATEEHAAICEIIRHNFEHYRGVLTATDVSTWLLMLLSRHVHAVSLRNRGGMYFVPVDQLPFWKKIVGVLRTVSNHELHEIPAMRSEETVEAVLSSVRREAEEAMAEMEKYLAGDLSTKGLNSTERRATEVQAKVAKYAKLLGEEMPDLELNATTILGTVSEAKIARKADK